MSNAVSDEVRAGIACLMLDLPPVNTLDHPLRLALSGCLERAALDAMNAKHRYISWASGK